MRRQRLLLSAATGLALLAGSGTAGAQTQIQWWHAMGGALGEKINEIAEGFNATQDTYQVVPTYKGNYTETMTAAVAAFRAGEQPHIVQVFEVGTATMMAAAGAIYPVHELMEQYGTSWNPDGFLEAVVGYYTTPDGEMLSMPFNSSTPVLYYNKAAFEAAGLDPESPPETWNELVEVAKKTQEAGYPCGFSTQWQSWVQVENMSAWHDKPLGTQSNGFEGVDAELVFNQNGITPRHIANMAEWQKSKIFDYGGRRGDADPKFYSGECAMFFASSAAYAGIKENVQGFEFGIGMLPYYDDIEGAPQNSIIGGATLWVLQGHEEEEYEGVAAFFDYLGSPEVQADWHQFTGYLPITEAAYELTKEQGFYEANPGTETAIKQITLNEPTENSKGLRFGNFVQIRDIINEELEAVWSGQKDAQSALDDAVARGNDLLRRFEQQTQ
ncbi:MAG TPA: sn-glycerol-3-phosphate ABC transporter substrate-binding protein UgpB [Geminicoccaceae bacterium]